MGLLRVGVYALVGMLVACAPVRSLPDVPDTSFYQDVVLNFPVDKQTLQRIRALVHQPGVLKIGLNTETPPFVMQGKDGSWHGFTIDYLKRIADITGQQIQWLPYNRLSDLLKDLQAGKLDVAAGGITDTWARRQQGMRFVPELRQDELAILTGVKKDTHISPELEVLIGIFLFSLMFYTWRNAQKLKRAGLPWADRWATAFHETVSVHFSRDPKLPTQTPAEKLMDAFQLIKGPAFLSLIITFAVVDYLNADYEIKNWSDIQHKVVVTKAGTNTVHLLQQQPLQAPSLREAVVMFLHGDADAVVHDASMLKHYAHMAPQYFRVIETGRNRSHTGFVLRDASLALAFQQSVNLMLSTGEYDMLLYGYGLRSKP